jgi:hypothetical protein
MTTIIIEIFYYASIGITIICFLCGWLILSGRVRGKGFLPGLGELVLILIILFCLLVFWGAYAIFMGDYYRAWLPIGIIIIPIIGLFLTDDESEINKKDAK